MSTWELITRLLIALLAGAAIGLEREWRAKAAGLRTHILVALGAAVYMLMSLSVIMDASGHGEKTLDPLRVVAGLISGIGFLSAGVIIEQRGNVHGLTTAASLWMTAALGAAAGLGHFVLAGLAATIALLVLWPIHYIEHKMPKLKDQPPSKH